MTEFRRIENELYNATYGIPKVGDADVIWDSIRKDDEILKEAIEVEKDKFGERDLVKGLAICDWMLWNYKYVNQEIYQELINLVYSNIDIARTVLDGASNGDYSYLLMTLWNHDLKLTDEQKQFAVEEAMNKIGTTRWKKREEEFSNELDKMGITDDTTTILDIDGCRNPVGTKTGAEYMNYMFSSLNSEQAHGVAPFDIRYHILKNPNWTIEEKKKLVYDFFSDQEDYDESLEQWEWDIINEHVNFKGDCISQLDKWELYEYSYNGLLEFYDGNKETTDTIWNEINFCRTMHILRPQEWELEFSFQKTVKK